LVEEVRYDRNPDFIFRTIVDEAVLVPIRRQVADMDCIYTLNSVGAFVWERLDGEATFAALQSAIVDRFDVEPGVAAADLREFLQGLEGIGAIRRAP
jgi:hypothetical protein